jgi:2-methylisocitrate lyase-like PEP mutase family enzyme
MATPSPQGDNLVRRLKAKLAERRALPVPGATNALGARVIADLGVEAVYVSGAG